MAQNSKKCAHSGCTCLVGKEADYCTPSCATAAAGDMRDTCYCGHPACANSESNASAEGHPASTIRKSY